MKNVSDYEVATAWDREIPWYLFQNTDPILFVLFISLLIYLLFQRGYQRQYFWKINYKVVGLWGSYGLKQGHYFAKF